MQTKINNMSRVSVNILGEMYTIRGAVDPGYISEVANLVDANMRELNHISSVKMSRKNLAVITAVNLADELLQLKKNRVSVEDQELEQRTSQLITMLDEGLIGDTVK